MTRTANHQHDVDDETLSRAVIRRRLLRVLQSNRQRHVTVGRHRAVVLLPGGHDSAIQMPLRDAVFNAHQP